MLDGTDAIMLSGETAAGKYPIEAVNAMVRIATYTEQHGLKQNVSEKIERDIVSQSSERTIADAVSFACVSMAHHLGAKAIITPSHSGTTVRKVARFHPTCPVIAPTMFEQTFHQLALNYGVVPVMMELTVGTDDLINGSVRVAREAGLVKNGDIVIVVAGVPTGISGTTNLIKAHIVGQEEA